MAKGNSGQDSGKELEGLKAQVAKLTERLEAARQEAGRYRVQRNIALKRAHAQETVLKAHNVGWKGSQEDLEKLTIEDGTVTGEYSYTPPDPNNKGGDKKSPPGTTPGALTFADVKGMSRTEIHERWDEVEKVMSSTPRT